MIETRPIGRTLEEIDKQSLLHPLTSFMDHLHGTPLIMAGGSGITVTDSRGRRYVDGFSGLYCTNIGYGRTEMAQAIAEQVQRLAFFHAYASNSHEPGIRLAERLLRMAPARMSKVFFGTSGSDANDTQVKIVWYYNNLLGRPKKKKIISRHRAYHGGTFMAGSLSGLPVFHRLFDLPLDRVIHTAAPYFYRRPNPRMSEVEFSRSLAGDLDALITREGSDTVAAFIAEPVMGTGGIIPPPEGYFAEIQEVLRKHDVLLIADEVVCGFGRLGAMFGSDVYGIDPDLITVAKGLTSGYVPMSACLVSEGIWQVLLGASGEVGPFGHGYTYTAHPVGAAAALANLDILEREGLVANALHSGRHLLERLRERLGDHPFVGDIRGRGLLAGVELAANRESGGAFDPALRVARRVVERCLEEGLIVRGLPGGDILAFAPPLIISEAQVDDVVERFGRGLDAVLDDLVRNREWSEADR